MSQRIRNTVLAALALGAIAVGAGTIANAASEDSSGSSQGSRAQSAPQHPGETLLTGDTAQKVEQAALEEVPGATILRVETDAEGSPYEAHMRKDDGTEVTAKVNKQFEVTDVQQGFGGGPGGGPGPAR
jgi:hypothetical protein